MKTKDIIAEINDLPVEQRAEIATQILEGLTAPDPEIQRAWAKEARRRLDEFEEGKVKAIPGDQVFEQLREKHSK